MKNQVPNRSGARMKAKFALVTVSFLLLSLGMLVGCSKGKSDAQLAGEVQGKIFSDQAVQSRQITVNSANGVVTLSGTVGTDAERAAVATDASKVDGIKMLVNNLQVQAAQAAPPANDQQMAQQQAPEPEPATRGKQAATSTRGHNRSARPTPS